MVIYTSGNLAGALFAAVQGRAQARHDNRGLPSCLVNRLYSYGSGGPTVAGDRPLLEYLNARFAEEGYRFPDLMRTIALSDAFSHVSASKAVLPPGNAAPPAQPQLQTAITPESVSGQQREAAGL
jgi:hypothetical protein